MTRAEADLLFSDVAVFADPDRTEQRIASFRNRTSTLNRR
jgi:aspartate ammonia-lyase